MVYISLLRSTNVSGKNRIPMNELTVLYEALKFNHVTTYIQSGNVIFESSGKDQNDIARKIESKIKESMGYDVAVLIRTPKDFANIITQNPFSGKDLHWLHVTFLSDKPNYIPQNEIDNVKEASEEYVFYGRNIYLYCPNGYGISKLSNRFFERKLTLSATTRNWNTVNKLLELSRK